MYSQAGLRREVHAVCSRWHIIICNEHAATELQKRRKGSRSREVVLEIKGRKACTKSVFPRLRDIVDGNSFNHVLRRAPTGIASDRIEDLAKPHAAVVYLTMTSPAVYAVPALGQQL